jgi:hypothetical protein
MMKRIRDRTGASFHRDMSGLSARVIVHIQLMCGSEMTLTRSGGVISSVPIRNRTLWYGRNFLVLFKFHIVMYILLPLREINLFQPYKFREWIDMKKPSLWQMKIPTIESKREYLKLMEEMRERRAR